MKSTIVRIYYVSSLTTRRDVRFLVDCGHILYLRWTFKDLNIGAESFLKYLSNSFWKKWWKPTFRKKSVPMCSKYNWCKVNYINKFLSITFVLLQGDEKRMDTPFMQIWPIFDHFRQKQSNNFILVRFIQIICCFSSSWIWAFFISFA